MIADLAKVKLMTRVLLNGKVRIIEIASAHYVLRR